MPLFRVAQECLTNVAKHSGAVACHLKLGWTRRCVTLEVSDNGKGFRPAELNERAGMGVQSMRERLRSVGGTLHIDAVPLHGATIRAQAPIAEVPTKHQDAEPPTEAGDQSKAQVA